MRFICFFVLAIVLAAPTVLFGAPVEVQQVGRAAAAKWIRGVIPLPHEISLRRSSRS